MAKIAYIEKNFSNSSSLIINQANDIIEEYFEDGLRLTLRQLYYQFVSRDLLKNEQKEYKRLGNIISDARLAGLIDWVAIEDRTRNLRGNTHWNNPGEIVHAAARGFQLDHWKGQEWRPEIWIEKEALVGVIAGICEKLDVSYFACKGYVSQSEMWAAAERLDNYLWGEPKQYPIIIHLGDHDPSGIDMTRDIEDRQIIFKALGKVKRIALNMDQVEIYHPPPNPAKFTDTRCSGYVAKYGDESWELDALEPKVMRDLIKRTILEYRNDDIYNEIINRENEYLGILNKIEKDWKLLI